MHISVAGLTKTYGRHRALDGISMEIEPGQIVAILGPNGAGKTTLLRVLATIAAPSAGEVRLDGELLRRDRIDLRRRLFFLPDTPYVLYGTAIRHIGMVLRLYEADRPAIEERVLELLREFDLLPLADVRLGGLSRGELYKAALVALIAADPEVWLFDEPFASGMDPRGIAALRNQAKAAVARGRTVIYSTQIMEVAERFSDRVCILHKGRVEALDSVDRLRAASGRAGDVLETILAALHAD